jgi:hypothetical protein
VLVWCDLVPRGSQRASGAHTWALVFRAREQARCATRSWCISDGNTPARLARCRIGLASAQGMHATEDERSACASETGLLFFGISSG